MLRIGCAAATVFWAAAAWAQQAHVTVTVNPTGQGDIHLGDSGPIGSTNPTLGPVTIRPGANPGDLNVTANVSINITLNKKKLNDYKVPDDNECNGMTIPGGKMEKWAADHEQEHVRQIQGALQDSLGGMTYNKGSGFSLGGFSGQPNTTVNGVDNLQKGVENALHGTLDDLAKQDASDYKNKVDDGKGTDGGLEGQARQKSCDEYFKDQVEHIGSHAGQATGESAKATAAAAAAKKAAADALTAAKACDKEAYAKAVAEYEKQKKEAEAHQKSARNLLNGMNDEIDELEKQLTRRANNVSGKKSPRLDAEAKRRQALADKVAELRQKAADTKTQLDADDQKIKDDLAAAAKDLAAAKEALAACVEPPKEQKEEPKTGGGGGGCGGDPPRDWRAQLRLGGSIGARNRDSQGSFGLVGERAVTPNRCGLVRVSFQTLFGGGSTIVMLGAGFEYDLRLPLKGLFVTLALDAGYAAALFPFNNTDHEGFLQPEAGLKWVFKGRFEVLVVPFSLPVFFGQYGTALSYQLLAGGGVTF